MMKLGTPKQWMIDIAGCFVVAVVIYILLKIVCV